MDSIVQNFTPKGESCCHYSIRSSKVCQCLCVDICTFMCVQVSHPCKCMHACVCMCTCVCVCCVYAWLYLYVRMYVHTCACVYTHIYKYVCIWVQMCVYVHICSAIFMSKHFVTEVNHQYKKRCYEIKCILTFKVLKMCADIFPIFLPQHFPNWVLQNKHMN